MYECVNVVEHMRVRTALGDLAQTTSAMLTMCAWLNSASFRLSSYGVNSEFISGRIPLASDGRYLYMVLQLRNIVNMVI